MRMLRLSKTEFDSSKQIQEDASSVLVPSILTREAILPFEGKRGYRPAKELDAAAYTLEGAWVVALDHIQSLFVTNRGDIRGRIENVKFCDKINGIIGNIRFQKASCDKAFLDGVKNGSLKDVSVAYFCEENLTPGKFGDEPYDFTQTNFMFGHVAAGVPEGRCPSPFCGMAVDSIFAKRGDPEETAKFIHIPIRDKALFVQEMDRTITLSASEGIEAVIGKLQSDPSGPTHIQTYLFAKDKGWTMEKAQAWVTQHRNDSISEDAVWSTRYIDDLPDSCFAYVEPGEKDAQGKTVPRSLRHLPFKSGDGTIDHDHLVNALARVSQAATLPYGGGKQAATKKLCAAVGSWNRDHPDSKIESSVCGTDSSGDSCVCSVEAAAAEVERTRRLLSSR